MFFLFEAFREIIKHSASKGSEHNYVGHNRTRIEKENPLVPDSPQRTIHSGLQRRLYVDLFILHVF